MCLFLKNHTLDFHQISDIFSSLKLIWVQTRVAILVFYKPKALNLVFWFALAWNILRPFFQAFWEFFCFHIWPPIFLKKKACFLCNSPRKLPYGERHVCSTAFTSSIRNELTLVVIIKQSTFCHNKFMIFVLLKCLCYQIRNWHFWPYGVANLADWQTGNLATLIPILLY